MNDEVFDLVGRKKKHLFPCVYHFYQEPPLIVRGEMQYLFDSQGRRYLDCYSGVSVVALGHCNPFILKRMKEQLDALQHTTTIYLTRPIVELAEALAGVAPGDLRRSFFVNSGSEANECACLLATLATGRFEFIALKHGLHGRTKLTMSLTGLGMWRTDPNPSGGISFLRSPLCLHCPLDRDRCDLACAGELEETIQATTSGRPAALIVEPIQGNGGIVVPPPGYFKRVKEILDARGILLILDEVQTGFGRTGAMFACEHEGIVPDILTVAKALGNGTPIGAVVTSDDLAEAYTRPGASTTGGNPVSAAAGLAVLDYLAANDLVGRARELGGRFIERLQNLAERDGGIADVRGRGLMVGMELWDRTGAPDATRTDALLESLKDRGYLAGKTGPGRNVLTFMPPLVVEEQDLDGLCDTLGDLLD